MPFVVFQIHVRKRHHTSLLAVEVPRTLSRLNLELNLERSQKTSSLSQVSELFLGSYLAVSPEALSLLSAPLFSATLGRAEIYNSWGQSPLCPLPLSDLRMPPFILIPLLSLIHI